MDQDQHDGPSHEETDSESLQSLLDSELIQLSLDFEDERLRELIN